MKEVPLIPFRCHDDETGELKIKLGFSQISRCATVNARCLVILHILLRVICLHTFRGQMGLSEEEQIKSQELRLQQNGGIIENSKEITQRPADKSNTRSSTSEVVSTGCCQQNGSSSCCQNPVMPEKDTVDAKERTAKVTPEKMKSSKKPLSRMKSGKGSTARKVCAIPTWFESWERDDTYAALAVACAVVSVAVAYKCYRQL